MFAGHTTNNKCSYTYVALIIVHSHQYCEYWSGKITWIES